MKRLGGFGLGILTAALVAVTALHAAAQQAQAPAGQDYMVAMRDGVKLATTVYLPEGDGPWPVILSRTPYDKSGLAGQAPKYTSAGYAFVGQDVRGKYASEGSYVPFTTDREDGYDTIVWIGEQDFCNGKIGMTGGSALGITANLAASADPPGLEAAYVVVAPQSSFRESTFINGVFKESQIAGWMGRQDAGSQVAMLRARVVLDESWKRTDFVHHMHHVDIPMFNVGGWYDIFLNGNVSNFMYLQNEGRIGARGNQKLLMGPFGHGELSGDLEYPGAMGALRGDQEIRWFDHWLKGVDNGIMDEPAVSYYMMAAARKSAFSSKNRFLTADNWPPQHTPVRYYLQPDGSLGTDAPDTHQAKTTYQFDPNNPVPTYGGGNLLIDKGPMDQRQVGERQDYLRFHTEPLTEDVAIAGPVLMELYAATDGPDTDFMVKLVDVYPDGYEALVLDNPIRARFRYGREPGDAELMTPGVPAKLEIDMWHTAITFEKGHRIGVHVTSSNFPRFAVNPNTGVPAMEPRTAANSVYHDALRPSAIVLPVLDTTRLMQDTD